MRWIWRLLKGSLALVLLVVIVVPTAIWIADPTVLRNLVFGQPLDEPASVQLSKPQARVRGASQVGDIPTGAATTLAAKPLVAAEALASKTSTVALLVWHRGALRYEKYWPPFDATTRTNPNSMHKTVLALAIGAAVTDGVIPSRDSKASRWLTEWQGDARRHPHDAKHGRKTCCTVFFTPTGRVAYHETRFILRERTQSLLPGHLDPVLFVFQFPVVNASAAFLFRDSPALAEG